MLALLPVMLLLAPAAAMPAEDDDYFDLSLDELAGAKVVTASKFAQKASDAPAAVTIITADEIALHGYETLGELLGSVRGMYSTYDRNYEYLGIRGIGRTNNFNNRFLLLIDGYRVNDTFYENAALGRDQLIQMELIDRVEIVRGPGSSVYGSNAFFGVINVITRNGADIDGVDIAAQVGTFDSTASRMTFGNKFDSGADLLLSLSSHTSDGEELIVFPEEDFQIPEKNFGVVTDRDGETASNVNFKFSFVNFSLFAAYGERNKEVPTAPFGSVINQLHETTDKKSTIGANYLHALQENMDINVRAYASRYEFERESVYDRINEDLPPFTLNIDKSTAGWWGSDVELSWLLDRQHFVAGVEFQKSDQLDHTVIDVEPFEELVNEQNVRQTWATYIQDEIRVSDKFLINVGLRYDDYSNFGNTVNPRAALIYSPKETTAVKLLYGSAFRAPSEFELHAGADRIANLGLQPEEIDTVEVVVEHYFAPDFRIIGSLYHNDLSNLTVLETDPIADMLVFRNSGEAKTIGAEVEIERIWQGGQRLRASYAWQQTDDKTSSQEPANSPRNEIKVKYATPFLYDRFQAGVDVQYLSDRDTLLTGTFDEDFPDSIYGVAGSYVLANVGLTGRFFDDRVTVGLDVNNLFDEKIEHPAGGENDQNVILQDGRVVQLRLTYSSSNNK